MGIAEKQDIPQRKVAEDGWTFRKLFSSSTVTETLAKVFVNPFEVLLGFLVFIIGVVELLGRHVSWPLWVFTIIILSAGMFERHNSVINVEAKSKKKK